MSGKVKKSGRSNLPTSSAALKLLANLRHVAHVAAKTRKLADGINGDRELAALGYLDLVIEEALARFLRGGRWWGWLLTHVRIM